MRKPEGFPPPEQKKIPETKELKRDLFVRAVTAWVEKLTRNKPEILKKTGLGRKFDLGAAFVPSALMALLMGCSDYNHTIVECEQDEQSLIDATVGWVISHPDEIQSQMNKAWPDATITASQLSSTLVNATIECGLVSESDLQSGDFAEGSYQFSTDTIVLAVNVDRFETHLDSFNRGEWTTDYTWDELVAEYNETGDPNVPYDYKSYTGSLAYYAYTVAHEAAHGPLGDHTDEDMERHDAMNADGTMTFDELRQVDEVYGWGVAGIDAGKKWQEGQMTPFGTEWLQDYFDQN